MRLTILEYTFHADRLRGTDARAPPPPVPSRPSTMPHTSSDSTSTPVTDCPFTITTPVDAAATLSSRRGCRP